MKTLQTVLTKTATQVFARSEYFECTGFTYGYASAIKAFIYAHGGSAPEGCPPPPSEKEWVAAINELVKMVADQKTMERVSVQVYNFSNPKDPRVGKRSGFTFSLDRKLLGWMKWI